MTDQLRIEKLLEPPEFITPDTLYLYKDDYDRLIVAQADRDGILVFATVNTDDVHAIVDQKLAEAPIINGPRTLTLNQTASYIITNYESTTNYNLTAMSGTVFRNDDTVTYMAPSTGVSCGFIINATQVHITISNPSMVIAPDFVSPIDNETEIPRDFTFISSEFAAAGDPDTHLSSDWQLATSNDFNNLLLFTANNTTKLTNWTATLLPVNTELFARVRYKGNILGLSDWSPIVKFTTKETFIATPSLSNITDGQISIPTDYNFTSSAFDKIAGTGAHEATDWQISTNDEFTNIVESSINSSTNKESWAATGLSVHTNYFVRVRYKADTGSYSAWSDVISFTTRTTFDTVPNTPIINPSLQGAIDIAPSLTINSSLLAVTTGTETHQYSQWQLATDAAFTNIIDSTVNDQFNRTTWLVQNLEANTTLYVRVRYKGIITDYSEWSTVVSFATKQTFDVNPVTPVITTPVDDAVGVLSNAVISSSAFSVLTGTDTHTSSTWELATDGAFTTVVASSIDSTVNKTSWTPDDLLAGTEYFIRVRYTGAYTGVSSWSSVTSFTTKNTYDTQPVKPTIISPVNNTTNLGPDVSVTSSVFTVNTGFEVHESSDWQVATNSNFADIIVDTSNETTYKTNINLQSLPVNSTLYIRARYKGATIGLSDWSDTVTISTKLSYSSTPNTPSIISPTNNATNVAADEELTSSVFAVGSGTDSHATSDWEIALNDDFTTIIKTVTSSTINKNTWTPGSLPVNTQLYARVRYTGEFTGISSWSSTVAFTTKTTYDTQPVLPSITSPVSETGDLGPDVAFTSTAIGVLTGTEIHESSDWQVSTDSSFSNIIKSVIDSSINKVTWTALSLPVNTILYARTRQKGATVGYSGWSNTIMFTTKQSYSTVPNTPVITSLANNSYDAAAQSGFISNSFAVNSGVDTHATSDWQIATDIEFTNIVKSAIASSTDKTTWTPGNLPVNTVLYTRVRYNGTYTGVSAWSTVITFSTKATYVTIPEITSPTNNATNQLNELIVSSNTFASEFTGDVHTSSDWQLSTNSGFTAIVQSATADTVNKVSWSVINLTENTAYYVRTRRTSANGGVSAWSTTIAFSTLTKYINAPTIITPSNGTNNLTPYVTVTTNAFSSSIAGQTHASTDWQIATDAGFSTIVAQSNANTTDKTSWSYATGLPSNTTYYVRARYNATSGLISNWSTASIFSTKAFYVNIPTISAPTTGATNQGPIVNVTTGAFSSDVTGETHTSTDWQLSVASNFSSIAFESLNDTTNKTTWNTPTLLANTLYYLRVRYKGSSSL